MNALLLLVFLIALFVLVAGVMNSERSNPALTIGAALLMAGCAGVIGFTLGDIRAGYTEERAERVVDLTAELLGEGRCAEVTRAYRAATQTADPLSETRRALSSMLPNASR